jgi:hypothetical protein
MHASHIGMVNLGFPGKGKLNSDQNEGELKQLQGETKRNHGQFIG